MRRAAVIASALAPVLAVAQVRVAAVEDAGGTVLGRICHDLDGDGRCSANEPGVPGARLLLDGGQVAVADEEGRFHFLDVPGRLLLPGRQAYGGHVVALEGGWGEERVRRYFELPAGGVAHVDLALPKGPDRPPARVGPATKPQAFSPQREPQVLVWGLSGHAPPGSRVRVAEQEASMAADGDFLSEVRLRPHHNLISLVITEPEGRLSLYLQEVHLVPRRQGGDAVVPFPPARLATVDLPPAGESARGLDFLVRGTVAEGVSLRIGGTVVEPGAGGAFAVRLPLRPGETTLAIEAALGDSVVSAAPRVRFERRGGAVAGLADVELSLPGKNRFFTGRGAVAARGAYDEIEGEVGIDLDDRDRKLDALLHPRDPAAVEHQVDPIRSFPTAGDRAGADDPNAARGRLYARLQAPGGRLDLGAMRPGFTGRELGRYDRSLYGGKLAAEGTVGDVQLQGTVFGSSLRADPGQAAPPRPAHEELGATGGSLFYLRHTEVVAGSEALRVEWRDAFTGLVVRQRTLVRTVDYEIDYVAGRVLLARPLASVQGAPAVATGDPFSAPGAVLIADYSFAAVGGYDDARGARGALGVGPLRFEAGVASENRPNGSYSLDTVAGELSLGSPLSLRAEVARSHGAAFDRPDGSNFARSLDGGLTFGLPQAPTAGDRDAFHLEARGEAAGARYGAWWRERPAGYSDSSHLETRNAFERGASVAYVAGPAEASAAYAGRHGADPRDPSGAAPLDAQEARGRAGTRFGDLRLSAEVIDSRMDAAGKSGSQVSGGLRADLRVAQWLTLDASHHQSLSRDGSGPAAVDATFSAVGATASSGDSSLSVRGGWGPALGPRLLVSGEQRGPGELVYGTFSVDPDAPAVFRESVSAMGVRRREGNAEVFTEEQFARDPFGLRMARVAGASLEPLRGVRVSASAESGSRLRLDDTLVERRAVATGASWVRGPLRLAARGELRQEGADHQAVAGAAAEWRATERLTLTGRGSWSNGISVGRRVYFADASIGCAYRSDGWSLLAKLAGISELPPITRPDGGVQRDTGLASMALTLDLVPRLAVGVGANLGLTRIAGAKEDLVSGSARAMYRVAGPVDVAVEYARRQALTGSDPDRVDAARLEAGWALGQGRIALGYNVFGFSGSGVDPADEEKGRVYLRAELVY